MASATAVADHHPALFGDEGRAHDPGLPARAGRAPGSAAGAGGASSDVPAFVVRLGERAQATAVVAGGRTVSYAALEQLVADTAARLGTGRRLVVIAAANTLPCLVAYLAALQAGHVVLMAPPCRAGELAERYDADTTVMTTDRAACDGPRTPASEPVVAHRHVAPAHEMHPDLALLLSTSGSTGSPKLVRLSRRNLDANACAIAEALGLRPTDRAITTLSPAYSYGLSVVNSHLAAGASLVLTDASVTEPGFWELALRERVTTLAGVPYTFELLDAIGFTGAELPGLRLMTCAGGRLPAEAARRYAGLGERHGWGLSLMYGATEATARMAIQPASLTRDHPDCVGHPLPGGTFRIADPGPDGVGTLAYRGPNVMMGYATGAADLARGPELLELVTTDRARITPEGLLQIAGRSGSFAKVFGLRIDLDDVDRALRGAGFEAVTVALDGRLGVAVAVRGRGGPASASRSAPVSGGRPPGPAVPDSRPVESGDVATVVTKATGLPPSVVSVALVEELPRTHTGKVDRGALAAVVASLAGASTPVAPQAPAASSARAARRLDRRRWLPVRGAAQPAVPRASRHGATLPHDDAPAENPLPADRLMTTYHQLLGKPVGPDDSFRSLGGDSLSYVAASVAVERICGELPRRWHELTIEQLAELAAKQAQPQIGARATSLQRGWLRSKHAETSVLLRAVAIVLVVGSHAGAMDIRGGAHVLIALAGYNLARFSLAERHLARRLGTMARSAAKVLVPALLWVAVLAAVTTTYTWNILGTNWLVNATTENDDWRYWFVETLLWIVPLVTLAVRVPAVERLRSRFPFALPATATVVAWALYRVAVPDVRPIELFSPPAVLWLFLLGWTIAEARSRRQQLAVAMLVLLLMPGSFTASRMIVIPVAVLLTIWADRIRLPAFAVVGCAVLAEASLFIYLSHWQVLEVADGWLALLLALPIGIAGHHGYLKGRRWIGARMTTAPFAPSRAGLPAAR